MVSEITIKQKQLLKIIFPFLHCINEYKTYIKLYILYIVFLQYMT